MNSGRVMNINEIQNPPIGGCPDEGLWLTFAGAFVPAKTVPGVWNGGLMHPPPGQSDK